MKQTEKLTHEQAVEKQRTQENHLVTYIIQKFLPNNGLDLSKGQWINQRRIALDLINPYPTKKFWESLPHPSKPKYRGGGPENIYSLKWFKTFGADLLYDHSLKLKAYKVEAEPAKKEYTFKEEKIGEDFKINKKPQNPLDFFK